MEIYVNLSVLVPTEFIRPEPQAMWHPRTEAKDWQADGIFVPRKLGEK